MNKIRIDKGQEDLIYFYLASLEKNQCNTIIRELKKPEKERIASMYGVSLNQIHMIGKISDIKSRDIGQIIKITEQERNKGEWYITHYLHEYSSTKYKKYSDVPEVEKKDVTPKMSQRWITPSILFIDKVKAIGNPSYGVIISNKKTKNEENTN